MHDDRDDDALALRRRIEKVALFVVREKLDVQNIISEVWMYFYTHPSATPSSMVIKWRIVDQIRRKAEGARDVVLRGEVVEEYDGERGVDAWDSLNVLFEKAKLEEEVMEVLWRKYYRDMSTVEIAEEMELRPEAVRDYLNVGLATLRLVASGEGALGE